MVQFSSTSIDTADNDPDQDPTGTEESDEAVKAVVWAVVLLHLYCYNPIGIYSYVGVYSHVRS